MISLQFVALWLHRPYPYKTFKESKKTRFRCLFLTLKIGHNNYFENNPESNLFMVYFTYLLDETKNYSFLNRYSFLYLSIYLDCHRIVNQSNIRIIDKVVKLSNSYINFRTRCFIQSRETLKSFHTTTHAYPILCLDYKSHLISSISIAHFRNVDWKHDEMKRK